MCIGLSKRKPKKYGKQLEKNNKIEYNIYVGVHTFYVAK